MTNDDGGWMLAMQAFTNNNYWTYDDGIWTNSTLINPTLAWNSADHIKTLIYTSKPFTQIRMVAGQNLSNCYSLIKMFQNSNKQKFVH